MKNENFLWFIFSKKSIFNNFGIMCQLEFFKNIFLTYLIKSRSHIHSLRDCSANSEQIFN